VDACWNSYQNGLCTFWTETVNLEPHLFIGSSREGIEVARSIQEHLEHTAECSVWDQGVFGLNDVTLQRLLELVETCDFGVFVCSADDIAEMRGTSKSVVRDNVLLELGMFMGGLGPQRTFFLIPRGAPDLRLPTDLIGITYGTYDADRRDRSWQQATGPFCTKVRIKIESEGFRRKKQHERLDNLAVAYACCEWIAGKEPYAGVERGRRKNQILLKMIEECRREPPNKRLLVAENLDVLSIPGLDYTASKMRIFASIEARLEPSDVDLILSVPLDSLPDGNARIRALYAATNVAEAFPPKPEEIKRLTNWQSGPSEEHYVRDAQKLLLESLARAKGG
jgi:predicted nucleotide-binding protein